MADRRDRARIDESGSLTKGKGTELRYDPALAIVECRDVYPPGDDTMLLLESIDVVKGEEILEMGCGSGMICIHCAAVGAEVTAVDVNENAVRCTLQNARRNGVRVNVVLSDLFSSISGKYDQIIFNPPYLPGHETDPLALSWSGGEGGVEVLDRFLRDSPRFLEPGGRITVVVSSRMDEELLRRSLSMFRIEEIADKRLFFERIRVLSLQVG